MEQSEDLNKEKGPVSVGGKMSQQQVDLELIDLVLAELFNGGDKKTLDLKTDIFSPHSIKYNDGETERFWDILTDTGLVNPAIGFGQAGKLSISSQGFQVMTKFGSYSNFLIAQAQAAQVQQGGQQTPQNPDQNS